MLEQPQFGQRLKALRLERGLSQTALAGDKLSTGYLSRLESGARPPTARVVKELAERLGVSAATFEEMESSTLSRVLAKVTSADGEDLGNQLTEALRTDDGRTPMLRWQALWVLAKLRSDQGRDAEELALLTELAALTDELGAMASLPELRARVRTQLSRSARVLGDIAKAREYAAEAVGLTGDLDLSDRLGALHALVSAEAEAGMLVEAKGHADELCGLAGKSGGTALTKALWASATVSIRQGDYDTARESLERALDGLDSHDDLSLWMRLRLAAASLYLQVTPPQIERATRRLDEIEPIVEVVGTARHRQEMLASRAHLAYREDRFDDARELCAEISRTEMRLSFRDRVRLEVLRSRLTIKAGQTDAGVAQLRELAAQAQAEHNVELAADVWRNLAEALAEQHG